MSATTLHRLADHGQAAWLDFIQRSFLTDGGFGELLDQGVRGVTSNPSIFKKAIAEHDEYDADIRRLAVGDSAPSSVYESLAIADISRAADMLLPLYEKTDGLDGYVSLEVSPTLAYDTERTVVDARRLHGAVGHPNLMIKIPATPEGFPAIEEVLAGGIHVNVTLIFSLAQYEQTVAAYLAGLERRVAEGKPVHGIASVASFFVSRVDTAVDARLEQLGRPDLRGRAAVDNAKLAYARFKELFAGPRWEALAAAGARVQRPLWASTATKNPAYPDTLYIDSLIGCDTVNTMPPATLDAFLDHGQTESSVERDLAGARSRMQTLRNLGVDMESLTAGLMRDGVAAFAESFDGLLQSVALKVDGLSRT